MLKLKETFPEACISWIVDDLTVSAKQGQLQELAEMVHAQGPDYGLFKHSTKGEFFSQMSVIDPQWKPLRDIPHKYRYTHAQRGFKRLLGAPFGDDA